MKTIKNKDKRKFKSMKKTLLILPAFALSGAAWATPSCALGTAVVQNMAAVAAARAAATTVFSADLTSATSLGDWTTADANADGNTWAVVDGIAGITYDSDNAAAGADEWLFSPSFAVAPGTDYLLSFTVRRQGAFDPDQLEVCVGSGATAADMATHLAEVSVEENITDLTYTFRFTAAAGQTAMHLGFHLTSQNASNGQLSLKSASVAATEKCVPAAVAELEAAMSHAQKKVTLTWTNPTADVNGVPLSEPLSVEITRDGELCATQEAQQPGSKGSCTIDIADFAGTTTFGVTALVGENRSELAELTVNLDDVQGDPVLVHAFSVDRSSASQWTIEGAKQAWHYDYADVFDYDYRKGGKQADEWLISPSVTLEAGKRYVLAYEVKTTRDFGCTFEVTVGEGAAAASQTKTVARYDELKQNGFEEYRSAQFAVETDGSYNVGFHAFASDYYIDLRNVRVYYIKEKDGTAVEGVSIAPQAAATSVYDITGRFVGNSLHGESHGIYVVKTTTADGKTTARKVMK